MTFGARLAEPWTSRGPLCVGIDPHAALLAAWGLDRRRRRAGAVRVTVVEALADRVAVLKPQSAFFERFGSRGRSPCWRRRSRAPRAGALVLMDAKRGDIGSTMAAYADAYLDPTLPAVLRTRSPSAPTSASARSTRWSTPRSRHGAGVFVLALTSNPEGPQVQHAVTPDGRTVAAQVLAPSPPATPGIDGLGSIGAVVGATIDQPDEIGPEHLDVDGPLLVPGIGAQGGTVDDVRRIFGSACRHVLPTSSREILAAGPDKSALHDAVLRVAESFSTLA